MARPKTKTHAESVAAYIQKAYDRIEVKVPKPYGEMFKQCCKENGTNPNKLLNEFISQYVKTPRD